MSSTMSGPAAAMKVDAASAARMRAGFDRGRVLTGGMYGLDIRAASPVPDGCGICAWLRWRGRGREGRSFRRWPGCEGDAAPLACRRCFTSLLPVTRDPSPHPRPAGHVILPACAIGGLSVLLAAGMEMLGAHRHMNAVISTLVSRGGSETFPNRLPDWSVWLAVMFFAFGLAFAMLSTPGLWRRILLWFSAVVLVTAWAPVLSLASYAPLISAPWIAAVWSGVCALVYTSHHRMACDEIPATHP